MILVVLLALCDPGEALLNSTLWMQSAAEYRASTLQSYAIARQTLDEGVAQKSTKPAAVVLDLDETVLDNSRYAARQLAQGKTFTFGDEWTAWVEESASTAVPGAVEFLRYAQSRGVTPIYVTNRLTIHKAATLENLRKLGIPFTEDTVIVRTDSSTDKTARRSAIETRYRVLLYAGDAMGDFPADETTPRIYVPNPVYGSWEKAELKTGAPPPPPSRSPCDDSRSGKTSR
ncbi:MAG TPA: HAD family acid phosphatase [Thermoanaerobaculia bacterium]|nr:HAD family acid phosphatase [Thermoanaerobaculia bacterium]